MSTPAHIVPEWYFLWVYAILRSIPNKLGGVAAIGLVFVCLLALPFLNTSQVRSSHFRPIYKKLFWLFVADCLILGGDRYGTSSDCRNMEVWRSFAAPNLRARTHRCGRRETVTMARMVATIEHH